MTYEEARRESAKDFYREMVREELEDKIHEYEDIVKMLPQDDWWKESLELAKEVLEEGSYKEAEDEADIENRLWYYGF